MKPKQKQQNYQNVWKNTFRDVNIALANELSKISAEIES